MAYKECQHVKAGGGTCTSPALKGQLYCYFHVAARDRIRRQRIAAERKLPLQLPILEDAESIQLAIGDVTNAMLSGRIDYRQAALALYALQTAAANIRRTFLGSGGSFLRYAPQHDPGLPEIEEAEPAPPPKKTAATTQPGEIIPVIQACAEVSPQKLPPRKQPQFDNAALVHSALKRLKKRAGA